MQITGRFLFIVGIIVALISAAKLPVTGTDWSNMLPLYVGAVIVSLLGLLLLHWHRLLPGKNRHTCSKHTISETIELLQRLLTEMRCLGEYINSSDGVQITTRVNTLLDKYLLPFVANQQKYLLELDQYKGLNVLVAIAQSERLLNRMWSAASDGNINEAVKTYPKALTAIKKAHNLCQEMLINNLR